VNSDYLFANAQYPAHQHYAECYRNGKTIHTGFVESTVNQVVSKRFYLLPQIQHRRRYPDPQRNLGADEYPARFKIHRPSGNFSLMKVRVAQGLYLRKPGLELL
jgi:hypothetical protein